MERMNGEIRDREKTMRGLKKKLPLFCKATNYTTTISDHIRHSTVKHQQSMRYSDRRKKQVDNTDTKRKQI